MQEPAENQGGTVGALPARMLDTSRTVASIVLDHSETGPVFQRNRIDFCCKGHFTLRDACADRGVDTGVLPPMIHATIAYGAIAANVAAIKVELDVLRESSRIVDEVNRLLEP